MKELNVPSIRQLLDTGAEKFGKKPFIKYLKNGIIEEKSFIQLREDSLAVCRFLRNISTKKMHIAVVGHTTYEYLVFVTGTLLSGNVMVPFAPETSVSEAVSIFSRADIDMIIHDSSFGSVEKICSALPLIKNTLDITGSGTLEEIKSTYSSDSEFAALSEYDVNIEDCAVIIYTSGTTGTRKGVMLSTKAFVGNVMYDEYCSALNESAVALSVLPMYHCFCLSGDYIRNLMDGITVCLNKSMRDLPESLKVFQPTVMRVVPMIAQTLLKMVKSTETRRHDLTPRQAAEVIFGKNINWLISGGAYLNPELVKEYQRLGINLRQGYGMTEAGCRISVPDEKCSLESVGRVTNICDVRIKGGEIQVKNDTLMLGYYKMPGESKKMFTDDGWLRTGDIGDVSEDGQLFVTGRLKNLIILSSGENVSPEAIEKKFNNYDAVSEILVYAENDRIVAEIYPNYDYCDENGIEDPESFITAIVKQANADAKPSHVIAKVIVRTQPLPRTKTGKIKRKETII